MPDDVISPSQMRAVEAQAIESGQVTGLGLMEIAGQGVVAACCHRWPNLAAHPATAVVLCGPGNNGGDGFVVARILRERGWSVVVVPVGWDALLSMGGPQDLGHSDAAVNARRWRDSGGVSCPVADVSLSTTGGPVLLVDALLGLGQNRPADAILGGYSDLWRRYHAEGSCNPVLSVSIDQPTGYDPATGAALGTLRFQADLAVTFHRPKPVHLTLAADGMPVRVVDLGL
ncbi:NAD(P)H-hydrate epimerase [Jannaschia pagri]|uniref:NAD(P)H-hydrate epimerase n=2 Tax=Jannaschia pagri TaxID=2829797 RepID=A0ABQ4NR52_9RHOB|nr:NAD(P)H-hydrate epimerase [Jannaschia sp. AI_61]GIT93054.1 NAD(P)H-hydrate epimerase [Jannaschia sp. AI_61]GIT96889.1 NAD(P)H-hydrate epimerase [Jannaschia sp. AI_62]